MRFRDREARLQIDWERYDAGRLRAEWNSRLGALSEALVSGSRPVKTGGRSYT